MEMEANFESRLHKTDKSVGAVSPNQSFLILRQDNRIVFRVDLEQIVRYVRQQGLSRVLSSRSESQVRAVKRTPASKKSSMEEKREKLVERKNCVREVQKNGHLCAAFLSNVKGGY